MFRPFIKILFWASAMLGLMAESRTVPLRYGIVLFPSMELQDVVGPLDPLQIVSFQQNLTLHLLSHSMEPVSSQIAAAHTFFGPAMVPTHTFAQAPELDVLIVPGGPGVRNLSTSAAAEAYIRKTAPKVSHLITICTGAILAGRAGALDGKRVTTNKSAWKNLTPTVPNAKWVAPARWMRDGNVWSSSGVLAGVDLMHAWIKEVFGEEEEQRVSGLTEFIPSPKQCDEPYTAKFNITPTAEKCVEKAK